MINVIVRKFSLKCALAADGSLRSWVRSVRKPAIVDRRLCALEKQLAASCCLCLGDYDVRFSA